MIITRADAIEAVHKYFVGALNNEPHEIDEDGDDVFTDMKSVNALLHHNKYVSKALKELPSAERPQGKWIDGPKGYYCSECGKWCDRGTHNFCPNCGKRMKVIDYVDRIKPLEEDDDWIPCSERLPENDDWVLGTVRYWDKAEDPIEAAYYIVDHLFYDGKWRMAGGSDVEQYNDVKVLAWMPLPAPYKERNL